MFLLKASVGLIFVFEVTMQMFEVIRASEYSLPTVKIYTRLVTQNLLLGSQVGPGCLFSGLRKQNHKFPRRTADVEDQEFF